MIEFVFRTSIFLYVFMNTWRHSRIKSKISRWKDCMLNIIVFNFGSHFQRKQVCILHDFCFDRSRNRLKTKILCQYFFKCSTFQNIRKRFCHLVGCCILNICIGILWCNTGIDRKCGRCYIVWGIGKSLVSTEHYTTNHKNNQKSPFHLNDAFDQVIKQSSNNILSYYEQSLLYSKFQSEINYLHKKKH